MALQMATGWVIPEKNSVNFTLPISPSPHRPRFLCRGSIPWLFAAPEATTALPIPIRFLPSSVFLILTAAPERMVRLSAVPEARERLAAAMAEMELSCSSLERPLRPFSFSSLPWAALTAAAPAERPRPRSTRTRPATQPLPARLEAEAGIEFAVATVITVQRTFQALSSRV